jgi:hypothetical protein
MSSITPAEEQQGTHHILEGPDLVMRLAPSEPGKARPRRDAIPQADLAPIWPVIGRLLKIQLALLSGLIFGFLVIGPVLGVLLLVTLSSLGCDVIDPVDAFLLGFGIGVIGTALLFGVMVWFDRW